MYNFSNTLSNCRSTLQRLAEYGHRQQEELLQKQQQLQQVHDHLMENSKSILAAQVCLAFDFFLMRFLRPVFIVVLLILGFMQTGIFRIKASQHVRCSR